MSSLNYVGPVATTGGAIARKRDIDSIIGASGGVSLSDLNTRADNAINPLATKTTVDQADGLRTTKTYVDQQDALNLAKNKIGAASGVASLDSSGAIPAAQLARTPHTKILGPWTYTGASRTSDGSATYNNDLYLFTITVPALNIGVARWMVYGTFEVYNAVGIRADVKAMFYQYEVSRARGRNNGSTAPYGVSMVPLTDVVGQTPSGWQTNVSNNIDFYLVAPFSGGTAGITVLDPDVGVFAIPA